METTRHFVATVYVVNDGATLLHEHETLGLWLPPGGHVDRDELPHEAARREAREETGLPVTILAGEGVESPTARELPRPRHLLLEDIDVCDGRVYHQHVDHVYYATADSRAVEPAAGEAPADAWEWVTADELAADGRFEPDVAAFGREAIAAASRSVSDETEV
ncbi:MAG: NUDIX domain-containing protein [Haloarculaceae archaeon]